MEITPEQYFAGSLTEEEKQKLFSAMDKDDTLRHTFVTERNLLTFVNQQEAADPHDALNFYRQFKKIVQIRMTRKLMLQALKYAAVVVLAIWLWSIRQQIETGHQMQERLFKIEAPSGHRTFIEMPDGTSVWLNARSKLTYHADFSYENRQVNLEGEAYFEVAGDEKHPFTVSTELVTISVTGTKFNVSAYPDETSSVTLIHGKVDVITPDTVLVLKPNEQVSVTQTKEIFRRPDKPLALKPNEQVSVIQPNEITHQKNVGTPAIYAWTNGEFYYLNKPLSDIAKDLERRFNVNITIEDKTIADELFTYHANESVTLDDILRHLKKTKIFNFSKKEDLIIIY